MSEAREKLLATLLESFAPNGDEMWNIGDDERRQANALINDFAHELAERQRALDVTTLTPLSPEEQRLVRLGIDCAADKIDPEVPGG